MCRSAANNRAGELDRAFDPGSVHHNVVLKFGRETGVSVSTEVKGCECYSPRITAATNALAHEADIAQVQEWLGYANLTTARLYDRRKMRPEDSPTFREEILRTLSRMKHQT